MPRVDTLIVVNCTPEEVFAAITDLDRAPEWLSAIEAVVDQSNHPPVVGTTFTEIARFMGKQLRTPKVVTAYDPPRLFSNRSTGGPIPQEFTIQLNPFIDGTEINLTFEAEPSGFFGALPIPVLVLAMKVLLSDNLVVFKKMLEGEREIENGELRMEN